MGSDPISCTFLTALIHAPECEVVGVVSQPDRERGRRLRVVPGPVKELALMHCVPVFTPEKVNSPESVEELARLKPDIIIVMAYGQILRSEILGMPPLGCVNLHVSILPRWRGASPVQYAIMAGDETTGVTAMMMDKGMDTGDILDVACCDILPEDTTGSLSLQLSKLGSDLMIDVIRKLQYGTIKRLPQNNNEATYAPKIQKECCVIEWSHPAVEIERTIRALNPRPSCHTFLPEKTNAYGELEPGLLLKIMRASVETLPPRAKLPLPGTVLMMKRGPLIATGDGMALRLQEVMPEGKPKPMSGEAFSNGYQNRLKIGDTLFQGFSSLS